MTCISKIQRHNGSGEMIARITITVNEPSRERQQHTFVAAHARSALMLPAIG
jgi:hypothetical protein